MAVPAAAGHAKGERMQVWLRSMGAAASALAISATVTVSSAEGVPEPTPGQAPPGADMLLDLVGMWLASRFELPAGAGAPHLFFASPEALARMHYGEGAAHDTGEVVAVYKDEENAIYLGEGWKAETAAEVSIMVHEMVHYLQDAAGMRFACPGERERLAYQAQQAWLEMFGSSLERAFEIDPATLLVRTTCAY